MIEYDKVSIGFNNRLILTGFSCKISKGEKVVIQGKSGSGKSTLVKLLLGFVKPIAGNILFNGVAIDKKVVAEFRKKASYVSQNTDFSEGNVMVFIYTIFELKNNIKKRPNREKIERYLHELELKSDILDKNIEELSGGEKQRISILIALLLEREIVILDEATSALDTELKKRVADLFLNNREITVIAISHDELWNLDKRVRLINI